jgi:hypothetical protein
MTETAADPNDPNKNCSKHGRPMPRTIRVHLDENRHPAIAGGLRRCGVDVTATPDVGFIESIFAYKALKPTHRPPPFLDLNRFHLGHVTPIRLERFGKPGRTAA